MKKQKKVAGYINCCPVCHCEIDAGIYFRDNSEMGKDYVNIACVECKAELRVSRAVNKGKGAKGIRIELIDIAGSGIEQGVERVVRMNPNAEKDVGLREVKNTLVYRPSDYKEGGK